MKLSFIKRGKTLIPTDREAIEQLERHQDGREVIVDFKPARNPRQHRLYMALLGLLVENTDLFETREAALTAVKIAIGEVDPHIDPATFEVNLIVRSIAFESCDQARFNGIFDATLRVICERYIEGADMEVLREEVYRMVDGDQAASLGKRAA